MAVDKHTSIPMDKLWQDSEARGVSEAALVIDVGGFEGPLDLLLHLARNQKVDLARISVLALAEQYLEFVESARRVRIELAADYLVMAAWLAYLKSKLLIPQQSRQEDGPSGEEMAAVLAFRLKRLEAMREAASHLVNRNRLGRDVFARGAPEHLPDRAGKTFEAELYDLLHAYANLRQRQAITQVTIERRKVWSLVEARELLTSMLGEIGDWTSLQAHLVEFLPPNDRVTATASAFAASLELVREGKLEMRQDSVFGSLYLRSPLNARLKAQMREKPDVDN
ncbi:segregation and condensation protein A [Rhizobium rhizoryzae]|uniref:Segregation and condensation protein A n=2 Tax=Rhizobium rhizoryzae TaxID=451876 RepID=A0A7W6LFD5_9HYPH|nr:segregation and condensation protein A [Rhizobium rhizoryzae]